MNISLLSSIMRNLAMSNLSALREQSSLRISVFCMRDAKSSLEVYFSVSTLCLCLCLCLCLSLHSFEFLLSLFVSPHPLPYPLLSFRDSLCGEERKPQHALCAANKL